MEYLREGEEGVRKGEKGEGERRARSAHPLTALYPASFTHWVPSRHDDSSVVGLGLDGVDDPCQLVHPLTSVVRVHVLVLGPEVSPLEPIHWAKVP